MQSDVKLFSFLASCGKPFFMSWVGREGAHCCHVGPKKKKKDTRESRRLSSAHPSRLHQRRCSASRPREAWTCQPAPCGTGYQACISLTNRLNLTHSFLWSVLQDFKAQIYSMNVLTLSLFDLLFLSVFSEIQGRNVNFMSSEYLCRWHASPAVR